MNVWKLSGREWIDYANTTTSALAACVLLVLSSTLAPPVQGLAFNHLSAFYVAEARYQVKAADKLPPNAFKAVCLYWKKHNNADRIYLDSTYAGGRAARIAASLGITVLHGSPNSTHLPSMPEGVQNCDFYTPEYVWTRPGHDVYLWSNLQTLRARNEMDSSSGSWLRIAQSAAGWSVRELQVTAPSESMQVAIIKELLWKPSSKRPLHVYVSNPADIAPLIHNRYTQVEGLEKAPKNYQGSSVAALEPHIGKVHWLDKSNAFVDFEAVSKYENQDAAQDIHRKWLLTQRAGHWVASDIGMAPQGE